MSYNDYKHNLRTIATGTQVCVTTPLEPAPTDQELAAALASGAPLERRTLLYHVYVNAWNLKNALLRQRAPGAKGVVLGMTSAPNVKETFYLVAHTQHVVGGDVYYSHTLAAYLASELETLPFTPAPYAPTPDALRVRATHALGKLSGLALGDANDLKRAVDLLAAGSDALEGMESNHPALMSSRLVDATPTFLTQQAVDAAYSYGEGAWTWLAHTLADHLRVEYDAANDYAEKLSLTLLYEADVAELAPMEEERTCLICGGKITDTERHYKADYCGDCLRKLDDAEQDALQQQERQKEDYLRGQS